MTRVPEEKLQEIELRLAGGDAEGVSNEIADLLFEEMPALVAEVRRFRELFRNPGDDADAVESAARQLHFNDDVEPILTDLAARLRQVNEIP